MTHHRASLALRLTRATAVALAAMALPAAAQDDRTQVVLGAAHVAGVNDTAWRTSLEVCNFGAVGRTVTLELLRRGQANPEPAAVPFLLPVGVCARFADVVSSLFGQDDAAGAIRVTCDGAGCVALGRTYNDSAAGTYGSAQPALGADDLVGSDDAAVLVHLSESAATDSGFRTNLELLNMTAGAIAVEVELHAAAGAELGTLTVDLEPHEVAQLGRVFRQVTSSSVADGYAVLRTATPGGAFLASASLVDNATGDGTTIPARPIPAGLPPLAPITAASAGRVEALLSLRIPDFDATGAGQCSVDFSPDGALLAAACGASTVPVWDAASGRLVRTLLGEPERVVAVAFTPDGSSLATAGLERRVELWDAATGALGREVGEAPAPVWELAFGPGGDLLAVASVNVFSSADPAAQVGMSLWDLATGAPLWSFAGDGETSSLGVAVDPAGTLVAFGALEDGVAVLDAATGAEVLAYPVAAPVADLAFSPDGQLLAAASDDTTIRLWRASGWELAATLAGHTHYVNGVAFHPGSELLVSGSHDRTLGLWEVTTGARLATLAGHTGPVLRVAVNPAGTLIASVSWDGTVRLWGVPAAG